MSLQRVGKIVGVAAAMMYVLAVWAVINTRIVPVKYLVIGIAVTALILVGILLVLFLKKLSTAVTVVLMAVSILIIGASLYVVSVSRSTSSFLDGIQQTPYSYETYSVIAEKNRHMTLPNAVKAGMIQNDPYQTEASEGLKKLTSVTTQTYNDPTSLIVALEADESDIAAVNDSYLQLLKENHESFEQNIEVLTTFRVQVKRATASSTASVSKPFVVYISGIDTYGDISSVSRSDVNMLAVVNPTTHTVLLVNTPRDYYVQLHGTTGTRDKLTHAGIYGIDMSRQTLEDLYGTKIDYYIRVNFTSLTSIVDALGGVNVYSDYDFKSFHTGYNQLDGKRALEFSRERHSFNEGDRQRGKNQQRVIEAIIAQMSDPKNAVNYQAILNSFQGALQTNMSREALTTSVNQQLNDMKRWRSESISVDGAGASAPTYSMGSQLLYVMVPNQQTVDAAKVKIQAYLSEQ